MRNQFRADVKVIDDIENKMRRIQISKTIMMSFQRVEAELITIM